MEKPPSLPPHQIRALTDLIEAFSPNLTEDELLAWVDLLFDEIRERARRSGAQRAA